MNPAYIKFVIRCLTLKIVIFSFRDSFLVGNCARCMYCNFSGVSSEFDDDWRTYVYDDPNHETSNLFPLLIVIYSPFQAEFLVALEYM